MKKKNLKLLEKPCILQQKGNETQKLSGLIYTQPVYMKVGDPR